MTEALEKLIGPRTPAELLAQHRWRYAFPTVCLGLAGFCLLVSVFLPYWQMTLLAPQYPGGLHVWVYVNKLSGDVREIDILNHYIGMRPLGEAAQLERSLSIFAIAVLTLLLVATVYVHNQFAALLSLPALVFPGIFLADLAFWLRNFGQHLDPHAPLSSAIKPFVPPLLGEGRVGQFRTIASLDIGFYLAILASVLIIVGLYLHRRAYKPLVEATQGS